MIHLRLIISISQKTIMNEQQLKTDLKKKLKQIQFFFKTMPTNGWIEETKVSIQNAFELWF
jgi:hypothetical protein